MVGQPGRRRGVRRGSGGAGSGPRRHRRPGGLVRPRRQARVDRRPPPARHVRAPGAGAGIRGSDGCRGDRRAARRARRPARPAVRRLRRTAGAGRPDGARPARGLRAHDRRDGDAPRRPGERRGRPTDPGEEGSRAGARRVPGARRRRAPRPAAGGPRLRRRHVHGRAPHRARPPRPPRRPRSPGTLDRRCTGGGLPRGHRGAGTACRHPAGARPPTRSGGRRRRGAHARRRGPFAVGPPAAEGRSRRRRVRRVGGRPVRARGGHLRRAQHRPVRGGDRLATGHPALSGARAGLALPRRQRRPAHRPRRRWRCPRAPTLGGIEAELARIADEGPSYARRDAAFALADLCWRTGRREAAAARYRILATHSTSEAVRRFCESRSEDTG